MQIFHKKIKSFGNDGILSSEILQGHLQRDWSKTETEQTGAEEGDNQIIYQKYTYQTGN